MEDLAPICSLYFLYQPTIVLVSRQRAYGVQVHFMRLVIDASKCMISTIDGK